MSHKTKFRQKVVVERCRSDTKGNEFHSVHHKRNIKEVGRSTSDMSGVVFIIHACRCEMSVVMCPVTLIKIRITVVWYHVISVHTGKILSIGPKIYDITFQVGSSPCFQVEMRHCFL